MTPAFTSYFYPPNLLERLVQFTYAVTPKNQMLVTQKNLINYLGYPAELTSLTNIWHPKERKKILRLEKELLDFARKHLITNGDLGMTVVSKMRKSNGTYIKISSCIYPILSNSYDINQGLICAHCMDISSLSCEEKVSFKVWKSSEATFDLESIQRHFTKSLSEQAVCFTDRQLDVLRAWSELDSAKLVAERLQIEIRTIETHLKNARKRLECRRTMDAVLYARGHGWI